MVFKHLRRTSGMSLKCWFVRCLAHGFVQIFWHWRERLARTIATQKCSSIEPGRCAYTHFLDHEGFLIDDMIFAVVSDEEILGVPNASMVPVMWKWFNSLLPEDGSITIENLSPQTSIIALQGPKAREYCESVLGQNHVGRFRWAEIQENPLGISGWIQGTGYTGEAGYEIFIPNADAPALWRGLVEAGATPVGLGARDTLRLEKGYLLSGVDFASPDLDDNKLLHRDSWETNVPFGLDVGHEFVGRNRVISHGPEDARLWGLNNLREDLCLVVAKKWKTWKETKLEP